jgi:hypothetical protein
MALTSGSATQIETRRNRFRRRLWTVCFAIFAFEIGMFLVVFPWLDSWSLNHLPSFFPAIQSDFQDLWDEPFLKGAVTGLGLINVYIAFWQVFGLIRTRKQY